jgi:hypothetical protein
MGDEGFYLCEVCGIWISAVIEYDTEAAVAIRRVVEVGFAVTGIRLRSVLVSGVVSAQVDDIGRQVGTVGVVSLKVDHLNAVGKCRIVKVAFSPET